MSPASVSPQWPSGGEASPRAAGYRIPWRDSLRINTLNTTIPARLAAATQRNAQANPIELSINAPPLVPISSVRLGDVHPALRGRKTISHHAIAPIRMTPPMMLPITHQLTGLAGDAGEV